MKIKMMKKLKEMMMINQKRKTQHKVIKEEDLQLRQIQNFLEDKESNS
jgi:hypothetical protein